jgi:hypothetical protein
MIFLFSAEQQLMRIEVTMKQVVIRRPVRNFAEERPAWLSVSRLGYPMDEGQPYLKFFVRSFAYDWFVDKRPPALTYLAACNIFCE